MKYSQLAYRSLQVEAALGFLAAICIWYYMAAWNAYPESSVQLTNFAQTFTYALAALFLLTVIPVFMARGILRNSRITKILFGAWSLLLCTGCFLIPVAIYHFILIAKMNQENRLA